MTFKNVNRITVSCVDNGYIVNVESAVGKSTKFETLVFTSKEALDAYMSTIAIKKATK